MSKPKLTRYRLHMGDRTTKVVRAEGYSRVGPTLEFYVGDKVTFEIPAARVVTIETEERKKRGSG